jgi:hypothetical protein
MAETKGKPNQIGNILTVIGIYFIILILWWLLNGDLPSLIIITGLYVVTILITILVIKIIKHRKTQLEAEEKTKTEKIALITKDQAKEIMDEDCKKEFLIPKKQTMFLRHNIQPDDPEKSPTMFYKRLFTERYSDNYFFQFVNLEDGEVQLVESEYPFNDEEQEKHLKNASKSSKDYIPKVTKVYDPYSGRLLRHDTEFLMPPQPRKLIAEPPPIKKSEEVVAEG